MKILVTGGAGFIGSHFLHLIFNRYKDYEIFCLDSLTYASNIENIKSLNLSPNFTFLKADITNLDLLEDLFLEYKFSHIVHFAAESHVDNSIKDPLVFAKTNVLGTINLLQCAIKYWKDSEEHLFYHVSTDEVFGALGPSGKFNESTAYYPNSPYSASKASSDHFVRAYGSTYNLPYLISNCSNNFGPYQHDEKLIPTVIRSIIRNEQIPIYGDGSNIRDWLYVEDHIRAIDSIFHSDLRNQTFCIGGDTELSNLELVKKIIKISDDLLGNEAGYSLDLISFVEDRKGHDFRYAIENSKLKESLGWTPISTFNDSLKITIKWYIDKYF